MSSPTELTGLRRTAQLSSARLAEALDELLSRHGAHAIIDLRADAYGHGAVEIERRSRQAGVTRFLRSTEDAVRAASGLSDSSTAEPMRDALLVYGLDGEREPVLSIEGEVIATKRVPEGTAVSYGYRYRTAQASTLALVGLGYADGIPRAASNRATVRIGEFRGTVAGSIAMDQLVVDIGAHAAAPGDTAVLWDDASSLSEWSTASGLPAVALLSRLGRRIHRQWSTT